MNRSVHKRTLEGDGEKPSRHENEGALLVFVLMYDGRKPKARIAEIMKFYSFENLQILRKARHVFFMFWFG